MANTQGIVSFGSPRVRLTLPFALAEDILLKLLCGQHLASNKVS